MAVRENKAMGNQEVQTGLTLITERLVAYCQANNWAGYDPYDALNSEAFNALPFLKSRFPRLVLTQALKRSPVNVRPALGIPKTQNAKALALFLSAFVNLDAQKVVDRKGLIQTMSERLVALRSPGMSYWCWGYSFPWQTRSVVVPKNTPNLVCTTFVAGALLDAYEQLHDLNYLNMAVSAGEYLLNDLYWDAGASGCGFSYPLPSLRSETYNANLLAAALLCRIYKHTGDQKLFGPAMKAARHSASMQRPDGSWFYGGPPSQHWIDNFHSGYNLTALRQIDEYLETSEFEERIERGFKFYKAHFIREDGAARYFHNKTYPIDIHCVAQSIITMIEFNYLDPTNISTALSVFNWAVRNMWDKRGFFYYRVLRTCTIRISYMRWSQAWMLLALSTLLKELNRTTKPSTMQKTNAVANAC